MYLERRMQWVKALREYQGEQVKLMNRRRARDPMGLPVGYHSHGVALELVPGMEMYYHPSHYFVQYGEERVAGGLTRSGMDWYGLTTGFPKVNVENETYTLVVLEDNYNWTFKQVADLLESLDEDWDGSAQYCRAKLRS